MNKTININLAGIIFHLDEAAYDAFKKYLTQVKNALESQEGGAEVIADIEARIAELFSMRLDEFSREVVSIEDVNFVTDTLGSPEEFEDDSGEYTGKQTKSSKTKKRLFRNPDEKFIGGVASGIAAYFGTDVVWIRILFLILLFFTGIGFITYIILWAAIPEAKTTAQKLQMRGEPVNISNIEKSVREELDGVKERFGRFREENKGTQGQIWDFLSRVGNFIINVLEAIFGFIFKFFSVILIIIGSVIGFVLFIALFGVIASTWNIGGFDFITIDGAVIGFNAAEAVLGNGVDLTLMRVGTLLTLLFPILGLIALIARAAGKPLANGRILNVVGGISFFVGLAFLLYAGGQVANTFKVGATEMSTIELEGQTFDLRADLLESPEGFLFEVDDEKLRIENVSLTIKKSFDSTATLVMKHRARGKSNSDARNRAGQFSYPVEQTGEVLSLNEYFTVPKEALYRGQELRTTLFLPVGTEIFLDPSVENLIYDIENVHNMWDGQMIGHTWKMERRGLVCLDCEDVEYYNTEEIEEQIEELEGSLEDDIERKIEELELEIKRLKEN